MTKTISHSFTALTREILFLLLEHKIHIFSPLCNIFYIFWNFFVFNIHSSSTVFQDISVSWKRDRGYTGNILNPLVENSTVNTYFRSKPKLSQTSSDQLRNSCQVFGSSSEIFAILQLNFENLPTYIFKSTFTKNLRKPQVHHFLILENASSSRVLWQHACDTVLEYNLE